MAKIFVAFRDMKLKSVEMKKENQSENWEWRKDFIGESGTLSIYKSECKYPGEWFAYLKCTDGSWLRTGYGKFNISNNEITIKTKNSIYVFEIDRKGTESWADEKADQEQ